MQLYHGSPKKLEILEPQQAKGKNEFQNLKAVFLTANYKEACLYALGKSLKGKAAFGVQNNKLIIVGNLKPNKEGFVYEFDISKEKVIEGKEKEDLGIYAVLEPITPKKVHKVKLKDLEKYILYVKTKEELIEKLYSE